MNKIYGSRSRFYKIWLGIKNRVGKHKNYKNISLSTDWYKFENFYNDMYQSYCEHINKYGLKDTSIERKDRFGNYCKENCIWATCEIQANNRSNGQYLTYNGETKSFSQWARKLGITRQAFQQRINKGWSIDKIFKTGKKVSHNFLMKLLLDDIMAGKYGTKNRSSLILRLQDLIDF